MSRIGYIKEDEAKLRERCNASLPDAVRRMASSLRAQNLNGAAEFVERQGREIVVLKDQLEFLKRPPIKYQESEWFGETKS